MSQDSPDSRADRLKAMVHRDPIEQYELFKALNAPKGGYQSPTADSDDNVETAGAGSGAGGGRGAFAADRIEEDYQAYSSHSGDGSAVTDLVRQKRGQGGKLKVAKSDKWRERQLLLKLLVLRHAAAKLQAEKLTTNLTQLIEDLDGTNGHDSLPLRLNQKLQDKSIDTPLQAIGDAALVPLLDMLAVLLPCLRDAGEQLSAEKLAFIRAGYAVADAVTVRKYQGVFGTIWSSATGRLQALTTENGMMYKAVGDWSGEKRYRNSDKSMPDYYDEQVLKPLSESCKAIAEISIVRKIKRVASPALPVLEPAPPTSDGAAPGPVPPTRTASLEQDVEIEQDETAAQADVPLLPTEPNIEDHYQPFTWRHFLWLLLGGGALAGAAMIGIHASWHLPATASMHAHFMEGVALFGVALCVTLAFFALSCVFLPRPKHPQKLEGLKKDGYELDVGRKLFFVGLAVCADFGLSYLALLHFSFGLKLTIIAIVAGAVIGTALFEAVARPWRLSNKALDILQQEVPAVPSSVIAAQAQTGRRPTQTTVSDSSMNPDRSEFSGATTGAGAGAGAGSA